MPNTSRFLILAAGISGALAVAVGAIGAHALEGYLDAHAMETYTKAATYHFYHTLALLGVGIYAKHRPSTMLTWSGRLFIIGMVLFSGSLYLLALTGIRQLGMITPLGGVAFIAGWACLVVNEQRTLNSEIGNSPNSVSP
ncbi:MAG TPA: DUF423 domain-containing protein [Candidatus Didemnitutus sp.]|nr:DUF423 domain-containing protein [Candidatus Didemnitutus sp.]